MRASWKILGFAGGVALAGMVGVACTVTTTNGDDDAGNIFDDDASDGTTTSDTGTTTDTGVPPACADTIYPDGGTRDLGVVGTGDCLSCTQASCCSQLSACFQDVTGDCQDLEFSCLEPCAEQPDAGGCADDCFSLYPNSTSLHEGWSNCQNTNCSVQCQ